LTAEFYPTGLAPHEPGAKIDAGKPLAGVLGEFGLALLEVAKVGTFGAEKYSRSGWQHATDGSIRYNDAMWRHLLLEHVEACAPDSGLLHEAHVAWNALARLELKLRMRQTRPMLMAGKPGNIAKRPD